jgi:phosphatidylglycerophosphatase A
MIRLAEILATWFGCGYAPFAPGTAGSLGALLPAVALSVYWGWPPWWFGVLGFAIALPGIWAADVTAKARNTKDPQLVVIDEVAGQWIAIAGMTAVNWKGWILAFALFRIFDIWKPFPVRKFESLPGGVGIVADDLMAGVYGALVLYGLGCLNLY